MQRASEKQVLEVCLLAGKILMESSAEMYRIEDTLTRIGIATDYPVVCYATQTGLFVGIDGMDNLRMAQITKRILNLDKVAQINQLSRKFSAEEITIEFFLTELKRIKDERIFFPQWLEILASAAISSSMMILFGGEIEDMLLTFLIGGLAYVIYLQAAKVFQIRFIAEFLASFIVGTLSILSMQWGFSEHINMMVIGAVMPFVPGVAITNAARDLLAGHLLSGVSRAAEASMTAGAIGFGIAFSFQLFQI